jgi:hypothetical protein
MQSAGSGDEIPTGCDSQKSASEFCVHVFLSVFSIANINNNH